MPLVFAIVLFAVAAIAECVRQGIVNLAPLASATLISAAMGFAALVLLGRDALHLVRPSASPLYGLSDLRWSWRRTGRLAIVAPLAILLPAAFAALVAPFHIVSPTALGLLAAFAVQTLVFAVPQQLFFTEAALKVFGPNLRLALAMSVIATAVFHLPGGLSGAVLAAATGLACIALRVAGMNIFAVAVVQGAITVVFGRVLVAQVDEITLWAYAVAYALGAAVFAALLLTRRGARRPEEPALSSVAR